MLLDTQHDAVALHLTNFVILNPKGDGSRMHEMLRGAQHDAHGSMAILSNSMRIQADKIKTRFEHFAVPRTLQDCQLIKMDYLPTPQKE
jgi:hypothetical protein